MRGSAQSLRKTGREAGQTGTNLKQLAAIPLGDVRFLQQPGDDQVIPANKLIKHAMSTAGRTLDELFPCVLTGCYRCALLSYVL